MSVLSTNFLPRQITLMYSLPIVIDQKNHTDHKNNTQNSYPKKACKHMKTFNLIDVGINHRNYRDIFHPPN